MSMADDASPRTRRDATYFIIVNALHAALPPAILTSPEVLRLRIDGAIAMVASLVPVNQAEAMLATNWVVTTMQAMDSQAAAHEPGVTPEWKMKCLAQANSMQRNARGLLEQLRQMQILRMKREGMEPSPDQAAWIEHRVEMTMQTMLGTLEGMRADAQPDQNPGPNPVDQYYETIPVRDESVAGDQDQNQNHMRDDRDHETNMIPDERTDHDQDRNTEHAPVKRDHETTMRDAAKPTAKPTRAADAHPPRRDAGPGRPPLPRPHPTIMDQPSRETAAAMVNAEPLG